MDPSSGVYMDVLIKNLCSNGSYIHANALSYGFIRLQNIFFGLYIC